jgi:hypothetical protein
MIATHVGREQVVEALGRQWKVGRWTRRVWADFLAWAKPLVPDPLKVAKRALAEFDPAFHAAIVERAVELSGEYLSVGSPQVGRLLDSVEGTVHVLWLLLKDGNPGVTEDDAFDLAAALGPVGLRAVLDASAGRVPPGAEGNAGAPTE